LHDAEGTVRAVLDSLLDPVVMLEPVRAEDGRVIDFVYVDANRAALEDNGTTYAELIGSRLLDLFPAHGPLGLVDRYARVVETGAPVVLNDHAYPNEVHGGEDRFYDTRVTKVGDAIAITWRDRTDQHVSRLALAAERARSRVTLDGLMDPVVLFTPVRDAGGRVTDFVFTEVNEAACDFNRTTRDELLGSMLSERYPDMWPLGMFDRFVSVVDDGTVLVAHDWRYVSSANGLSWVLDLRGHRVSGSIAVTWRDVTDRLTAQEALAQSERRFRVMAENATDVVFEVDAAGLIDWVSPAIEARLGWTAEAVMGTNILDLVEADSLAAAWSSWEATGQGVAILRTRAGGPRSMSFRATNLADEHGVAVGAILGMSDITDILVSERAAAEAHEAEERTRLSMDEAAVGLLIADRDGIITYANPALHRIFHVPPGTIVGLDILDGAAGDERRKVAEVVDRVLSGESEHEHLRRSMAHLMGAPVWVDTFISPMRGPDGSIDGALGQILDVTGEVANREALARSVEHYRLLAENASDVVYETDSQGLMRWVSPSVRQALGWEPDMLLGTIAVDLIHPDDRPWVERERAEVYEGTDKTGLVARFMTVDGGVRYMATSARVLRDSEGNVTGAVVGLHDVTEETRMRRRLERSERTFRAAVLGAPQGVAISNLQDFLTDVNPAAETLLGDTKQRILGRRLGDFVVPSDPPTPACVELLLASGQSRIGEHEHQLATPAEDGGSAWIAHSVSAIRDDDGSALFFVHHLLDVTDRHRREEDLGHRATHDTLTGLLNRHGLMTRVEDWLPARRDGDLAVLYCDLDGLKAINDCHGHSAGDAVLAAVALRIEENVRRGDLVARISGDEFVVVLDRIQSEADALSVADKVCHGVTAPVLVHDGEIVPALSVGVAFAEVADTVTTLFARADAALYRAKAGGRGRVAR
jgi:diguanylate cyclase (GGDEF)-like protein/PAS domain S-box-containing protein